MIARAALLVVIAASAACVAPQSDTASNNRYRADIRWTAFGIPHVKAGDWGSLGYGFAYATATDGVCVFAREVASANGSLSSDFGYSDSRYASDVFHRALLNDARLQRFAAAQSASALDFNAGFVARYNRYLREHEGTLPASCQGEIWVRPITADDLGRTMIAFGVRYGLGRFMDGIAMAAPPGEATSNVRLDFDAQAGYGSNAIAIGNALSETGSGILLGNPHYPWHGPARFHMIHVTIPGVVDAMGASLLAGNFIGIGFNKDIAWTHTVSTAARFTLYELDINPDDPLQYRYGGQFRDMDARQVHVPVTLGDGRREQREHTVYLTHHGPVLASEALPWTTGKAFAIRDAILDNDAAMATYEALQTAATVADVESALRRQGVFFVNTIAADRHGDIFYGDVSATPNIDADMLAQCRRSADGVPAEVLIFDGTDPACEWKNDTRSQVAGAMPADLMPRATGTTYFTNSNDSYWLSNPDRPLEGFVPTIGDERTPRSLRTRAGLTFVQEQIDGDGSLSAADVQRMLFSHRHYGAVLLLDDVLTLCAAASNDIASACAALAAWDRRAGTDSRGTQVWTEFWEIARTVPDVYAVPFDIADPVNTPRGLAIDVPDIRAALLDALAQAARRLQDAGLEPDTRWGDVQFAERNGERIPIPGAPGWHGVFSYIDARLTPGKGYTPIRSGNSYIQVVSWTDDGVLDARGILTYSQSPEPDSPHYADQTHLYSAGEWLRLPFTDADIEADPQLRTLTLTTQD